ncbi:MAG: MFS transporter [Streptosporangiales bacterium]|nr:MFS transporter [Streptosporangiales bacterium]
MGRDHSEQATYGQVFAIREFRALWGAQVLSLLGDQLAQVALAVLVYNRTGSPLLTALTYALTYLPPILGGPLLAGLADVLPRRQVMIVTDLIRALLVGLMAIPGTPFPVLCVLLFFTVLLSAPFSAARAAILPDVLPGDRYVLGSAVTNITNQAAQVVGFLTGGGIVALLGTHQALALDAATFLASALVLRAWLAERSAPGRSEGRPSLLANVAAGTRLVFGDRRLRALVSFAWLCGFYVVPEGLAAPYAAALGGGPVTVGLLMAAMPIGTVVGLFAFGRFVSPPRRLRMMGTLALLASAPLVFSALQPALPVTLALWVLAGAGSSYQLAANTAFMITVPPSDRGQAFGLVQPGMLAAQGLGIVLAGMVAEFVGPELTVALFGMAGLSVTAVLALNWNRVVAHVPGAASDDGPQPEGAPSA